MDINFVSCYFLEFIDEFSSFLVESLGFSMYSTMSSAKKKTGFEDITIETLQHEKKEKWLKQSSYIWHNIK